MAELNIDDLGPVDYIVVEFPPGDSNFDGEVAGELAALVDKGLIRILDIVVLEKGTDGSIEGIEIDDLDDVDVLRELETELAEVLALEDVADLAAGMAPG